MYLGDFATGATVRHRFYTTDVTGALVTLAGTPSCQVRFGAGSGTAITTGVTLAVDVVTGQHIVTIDLSASGSYAAGADYAIEVAAGTVNSVSIVGTVLAQFSIQNRYAFATAAGIRTAVGLASANLDTQVAALAATLATIAGYIDTEVAAIKAVTDQFTAAQTEPTSVPAANASPLAKIAWMAALARNKVTQTATTQILKADDGSTTIGTAAVSDDGTTFTRGEFA